MNWDKANIINLVKRQKRGGVFKSYRWVSQFQDNVVSFLPDDPDYILLALDGKEINYPDVYKVNVHTADRKRVVKTRSHVVDWMADEKGAICPGCLWL
ncbi:MAG: hypothetical protein JKY59_05570 [Emcibacter sp.]|nr:hypothetical protein [Emcibacter sp.]